MHLTITVNPSGTEHENQTSIKVSVEVVGTATVAVKASAAEAKNDYEVLVEGGKPFVITGTTSPAKETDSEILAVAAPQGSSSTKANTGTQTDKIVSTTINAGTQTDKPVPSNANTGIQTDKPVSGTTTGTKTNETASTTIVGTTKPSRKRGRSPLPSSSTAESQPPKRTRGKPTPVPAEIPVPDDGPVEPSPTRWVRFPTMYEALSEYVGVLKSEWRPIWVPGRRDCETPRQYKRRKRDERKEAKIMKARFVRWHKAEFECEPTEECRYEDMVELVYKRGGLRLVRASTLQSWAERDGDNGTDVDTDVESTEESDDESD